MIDQLADTLVFDPHCEITEHHDPCAQPAAWSMSCPCGHVAFTCARHGGIFTGLAFECFRCGVTSPAVGVAWRSLHHADAS